VNIIDSTQGNLEHPKRPKRPKRLTRLILVALLGSLSVFLASDALRSFQSLLTQRQAMNILWYGQTENNFWGIGQIGAPLAWLPLLIDMSRSATTDIRQWQKGRGQGSEAQRLDKRDNGYLSRIQSDESVNATELQSISNSAFNEKSRTRSYSF
jgi:hypothetical protein